MAVAEARAVWQRTANRCFVQEDAKRAPKLACCQSSSSSSKQVDGGPVNGADMPDDPAVGFMHHHRNAYSNLPPDTRWWLQLQPSYGYQKGLTNEQLNALEAEMENLRAEIVNSASKVGDVHNDDIGCTLLVGDKNVQSPVNSVHRINSNCVKEDTGVRKQEAEILYDENSKEFTDLKGTTESLKLMDMETTECSPWLASEKIVPWWRTTDRDDLASLVAQKSLDYVENCDLPPPQKRHVKRYSGGHPGSFDYDDVFSSIVQDGGLSPERAHGNQRASREGILQSGSDQPFSSGTSHENTCCVKAQLLEALCHFQTRAREAEKVAKEACEEKEHIVKLFLRQASQLFAYKQWCQLLQLETLYYQVKNGEQPISNLFPVGLPWIPQKGRKLRKNMQKSTRSRIGRPGQPCNDISKYAVAFALGLSLVGAGLLLGWTVGWMLPL